MSWEENQLPRLIELPTVQDPSGNITFAQTGMLPFDLKRTYFLHGVPDWSHRGRHAHRGLHELIVAASGSFIVTTEGLSGAQHEFLLDEPSRGLYIPPIHWRDLERFSDDALCLVLCSDVYDESDYIRDYETFRSLR